MRMTKWVSGSESKQEREKVKDERNKEWDEPNILLKFSACSTFSSFRFHLENLDIKNRVEKKLFFFLTHSFKREREREHKRLIKFNILSVQKLQVILSLASNFLFMLQQEQFFSFNVKFSRKRAKSLIKKNLFLYFVFVFRFPRECLTWEVHALPSNEV